MRPTDVAPGCPVVTQGFGCTPFAGECAVSSAVCATGWYHDGVDLAGPDCRDTPLLAVGDGMIEAIGQSWPGSGGLGPGAILLRMADGVYAGYGHGVAECRIGERVRRGQRIGRVNTLGFSTECHLHLTVRTQLGTVPQGCLDPLAYTGPGQPVEDCMYSYQDGRLGAMPHIPLPSGEPGIRGLFAFRPETGVPLCELAEVLLRGPSTLARGERELIAAYVSGLNDCNFCRMSHSAFAAAQLDGGMEIVERVRADYHCAPVSPKVKALLGIATAVQNNGKAVTTQHVRAARQAGASDVEIHDTVLIAAAFCMYNRYVDGLATLSSKDPDDYSDDAQVIVEHGYLHE